MNTNNKEYKFLLNDQDISIISMALSEMPYKMSAPLINKMNYQISQKQIETDSNASEGDDMNTDER